VKPQVNYAKEAADTIFTRSNEYPISSIQYRAMTAYLLLGSNEGDRQQWLSDAVRHIEASCGKVISSSSVYTTAAWGLEEQPDFLNMAIAIKTELSAPDLLEEILAVEKLLGRERTVKWGQRTIDIDILFFGNDIIDLPELKVPHPFIQDRRFALAPMNEIAPDLAHPVFNKSIAQLLAECPDQLEVTIV
jgi:2-amino-4-hydroxy-6-hydroxymethyldihydropteridine diphosphokinase